MDGGAAGVRAHKELPFPGSSSYLTPSPFLGVHIRALALHLVSDSLQLSVTRRAAMTSLAPATTAGLAPSAPPFNSAPTPTVRLAIFVVVTSYFFASESHSMHLAVSAPNFCLPTCADWFAVSPTTETTYSQVTLKITATVVSGG